MGREPHRGSRRSPLLLSPKVEAEVRRFLVGWNNRAVADRMPERVVDWEALPPSARVLLATALFGLLYRPELLELAAADISEGRVPSVSRATPEKDPRLW